MPEFFDATGFFDEVHRLSKATEVTGTGAGNLPLNQGLRLAAELVLRARAAGGAVMVVGNGGSAAIAMHLQTDLALACFCRCLTFFDGPLLTAMANDFGYPAALARQARLHAGAGGLLVAISSSGMSENIVSAVQACRETGCAVVTLSGFRQDNRLRGLGDLNFYVPVSDYGLVESVHSNLTHCLSDMIKHHDAAHPAK